MNTLLIAILAILAADSDPTLVAFIVIILIAIN